MDSVAWTHKGLEEVAAKEIAKPVKISDSMLFFKTRDAKELCRVCYMLRSLRGLMLFLDAATKKDIEKTLKKVDFSPWVKTTFAVRVKRFDNTDTENIEALVGNIVAKQTKAKVDLSEPQTVVLVLAINQRYHFGIDFAGIDLGKRDYKIFSSRASLKGSLAYGMLSLSGFKPGHTLLDPFARDGVIGIEAALASVKRSPHFFQKERFAFNKLPLDFSLEKSFAAWDKAQGKSSKIQMYDAQFHNVQAIRKNSKIAGVEKAINVSRLEIDWIDTKWGNASVDSIVSYPPQFTQRSNKKTITKLFTELFHQASFVLKKNGKMVLAMHSTEPLDNISSDLKLKRIVQAYQGKELLNLVVFQKSQ